MAKPKFYAVKKGKRPGIYTTWDETAAQVQGFPGAVYKGFATREEALDFLQGRAAAPHESQSALFSMEPTPPAETSPETAPADQAVIYTDGGAIGNPGRGGYGVVIHAGGQRRELSGGFGLTTNNRMELTAVIVALEALGGSGPVVVYSDSSYLVNAMTKGWARRWQQMRWQRKEGPVPNADLWKRLLALVQDREVRFEWVRGHAGNPENERCDRLAVAAAQRPNLPVDEGFEKSRDSTE